MKDRRTSVSLAIIWSCMAFFAFQTSALGLSYIFGDLRDFDPLFREKYTAHLTLVRCHGIAGAVALCLGLTTFVPSLLRVGFHKALGRVYAGAVLIAGVTALPMAAMAEGGASSRLAFLTQACFWLGTLVAAVIAARGRQLRQHRRFMVYNYSLTYSAAVSRLLLNGLQETGLDFTDIYPVVSWTWLFGLATAQWWLWYSQLEPRQPRKEST